MRISDWSSDVCSSDLRPHFTQVHAYGVVRAIDCFLLLFGNGAACSTVAIAILVCLIDSFRLVLGAVVAVLAGFLIFDDIEAHIIERGPSVLDLLRRHLVLRQRSEERLCGKELVSTCIFRLSPI